MENFLTNNINQAMILFLHGKIEESIAHFKEIKRKRYLFPSNVIPLVSLYPELLKELVKHNLINDTDFFDIRYHFLLPISSKFLVDKDNVDFFINKCPDALLDFVSYGLSFVEDETDFLKMYSSLQPYVIKNIKEKLDNDFSTLDKNKTRNDLLYFEQQLPEALRNDWNLQLEE